MKTDQIRRRFLDFFRGKDHPVVASDSLVAAGDPTLLFTGAGMNQFKPHFLGLRKEMRRAASCQKCFRTGDVEQVGKTPSHLTFFEMLGNFSFGDYFKEEACLWAWEFLTRQLGLPERRLWASVYEQDEEAARIWAEQVGLPKERIVRFGPKENFWPSNAPADGPNGPCGPCSEIYYDYERCLRGKACPDPDRCAPGCGCGRFVEVWNLVFTQFDRQPDGSLKPLPARNIDTGMGLERLAAVMQDKMSVFETDGFEPILAETARLLREQAPDRLAADRREAVCAAADHVRALTFLIADGVVPSNEGRGYVLRMLVRRAARGGIRLGLKDPFLFRLVPVVTRLMREPYPELEQRRESIAQAVSEEEGRFHRMLAEKLPLLDAEMNKIKSKGLSFPEEAAARFYDTHGLGWEEITEACRRHGLAPPQRAAFEAAVEALQAKSRARSKFGGEIFKQDEAAALAARVASSTEFVGYEALTAEARVLGLIRDGHLEERVRAGEEVGVILDRSPFYGEAGGQVGDTGQIRGPAGRLRVEDTQWAAGVLVHRARVEEGQIRLQESVTARVDGDRRRRIARNHTATHLLHAALRRVLGAHVAQAGSLVGPDHLRFDFSHGKALKSGQRKQVEELVNEWVESALPVSAERMPLAEARRRGALALFGEKYGQEVRVISIGEVSLELCGGTHLNSSGELGLVTITEEGSVAAGMRRIKALSDPEASLALEERLARQRQELEHLRFQPADAALGPEAIRREVAPRKKLELFESVWNRQQEALERSKKELKDKEAERRCRKTERAVERLEALVPEKVGNFVFYFQLVTEPADHGILRSCVDAIRKKDPDAAVFLLEPGGFCVAARAGAAEAAGIRADEMLQVATEAAGGSGGGRAHLAQGRLETPERSEQVRKRLVDYLSKGKG